MNGSQSSNYPLALLSSTTAATTPAPIITATDVSPSTTDTTSTAATLSDLQKQLHVYSDIFNTNINNDEKESLIDEKTQLLTSKSLNKNLFNHLQLSDNNYVLCMIDVDGLKNINEKLGYDGANAKISQIGTVIYNFCQKNPRALSGYKCNEVVKGKGDLFGVLIYCKNGKLKRSQEYIKMLMKQIKSLTNESVSVGIAKMCEWETYNEWKLRAFNNISKVKEKGKGYDGYYSDIDIEFKKSETTTISTAQTLTDEKKEEAEKVEESRSSRRLGSNEEFELKLQEIANDEDENWIVSVMDIDDLGQFLFENDNDRLKVKPEIDKLEEIMMDLFNALDYGKNKNSKDKRYFGYNMTDGDEYSMILYDSKNLDDCIISGHDILEALRSLIEEKCLFTVSIGYGRIVDDDLGMPHKVFERVNKHLKQAKKHGKNRVHFGQKLVRLDSIVSTGGIPTPIERKSSFNVLNTEQEDKITAQSLQLIEKYGFVAAVKLKDVKIIANSGDLINENENDIDVLCDYDPTRNDHDLSYKQLFYQTVKFVQTNTRYLNYPKWYLNGKKAKCNDKKHCKQCFIDTHSNNTSSNSFVFSLCSIKRREIGNHLLSIGKKRQCMTDSLSKTATSLLLCDDRLIAQSNKYKFSENWFIKVYSFLKWQHEVVKSLITRFVYSTQNNNTRSRQEEEIIGKLSVLTLLDSYYDELIEYLLLFYCCFDSKLWIYIFYSFIEYGIGTFECKKLFGAFEKDDDDDTRKYVESIASTLLTQIGGIGREDEETDMFGIEQMKDKILKETKGLSVIKQLFYGVYDDDEMNGDDDVAIDANEDAFDLSKRIYLKLNETINNVKTQILIMEMSGIGDNSGENKVAMVNIEDSSSNRDEERKDDWSINNNTYDIDDNNNENFNIKVPSFIRLLVIRRIIGKYIKDTSSFKSVTEDVKPDPKLIDDLVNVFNNDKAQLKEAANLILIRLINDGVGVYMNKWYNEKIESVIIEDIFNKIILKKFAKEYNELVTFSNNNNNDRYYQNLVFNSKDIMTTIFQHLKWQTRYGKFDGDLFNCSLVNSIWLYHSWNINSVYYVNLAELIEETLNYSNNDNNHVIRIWQRISHAKSIDARLSDDEVSDWSVVQSRLSRMKNVDEMDIRISNINVMNIAILKFLMSRSKDKIKYCYIYVDTRKIDKKDLREDQLSPLRLTNATSVIIRDLYFYRSWSNKCTQIELNYVKISKDCCQFWIDNCDCSNVKILKLFDVDIEFDDKSLLKQLASKFSNLKKFKIDFRYHFNKNVMLFWQLLKPAIVTNNVKVELDFSDVYDVDEYNLLNKMTMQHDLKIERLTVSDESALKFAQQRDDCGLNHLTLKGLKTTDITDVWKKLSFKSITSVEAQVYGNWWYEINNLVQLDVIVNKQLFVIVGNPHYQTKVNDNKKDEFLKSFTRLSKNICKLFNKQIPMYTKLRVKRMDKKLFKSCFEIYSSYFENKEFYNEYIEPKCNSQFCSPRIIPLISLVNDEDGDTWEFLATNVEYEYS